MRAKKKGMVASGVALAATMFALGGSPGLAVAAPSTSPTPTATKSATPNVKGTATASPSASGSTTPSAKASATPQRRSGVQSVNEPEATQQAQVQARSATVNANTMEDQFDGPAGAAPDGNLWGYDLGAGGWGNGETQTYTDSRENSYLDGTGNLIIEAKNPGQSSTGQWTSARLVTRDKFDFQYGRAEARIKVPQGGGTWPAFWALGTQGVWPQTDELDIFEGNALRKTDNLSNVFGGNAWNDLRMIDGWTTQSAPLGQTHHVYAMEWTPDTIQYFFDGRLHHEVTRANMGSDWRANQPNYLILNVAIGGGFGGPIDNGTTDTKMEVDYVKVSNNTSVVNTGALNISKKWISLGGVNGAPGDSPRNDPRTHCGLKEGGCFQNFQNGLMYWSPNSGAHFVSGPALAKLRDTGWENGRLGYPTSDEFCGLKDGGCGQAFQGGMVYWSPNSGVHTVWGAPLEKFRETGWENGRLGYPTSDEFCGLRNGGCAQAFQGGMVYWSPNSGVHTVWGAPLEKYRSMGWEVSGLGYPTSDEFCGLKDGGCGQRFEGGYIYWSPKVGTHFVWGDIARKYAQHGWEAGRMGYPTTDEFCGLKNGGCAQSFEDGMIYFSPATGSHSIWGALLQQYAARGYERSSLGYPTSDEISQSWGWEQFFQGGRLWLNR